MKKDSQHNEKIEVKLKLNKNVEVLLKEFKRYGQGYIVGSAVRDMLLGKNPSDISFATNINYNRLKNIFSSYYPKEIEKKYGILEVKINNEKYEISKFRKYVGDETIYPEAVEFTEDINSDLLRSDFTINSLAYNNSGLVDPFNGHEDLKNKKLKLVGNPILKIEKDPFIILKAFVYIAELGFELESKTRQAIKLKKDILKNFDVDKINSEISKILVSEYAEKAIIEMHKLKILEIIVPEIKELYDKNPEDAKRVFFHSIRVMHRVKPELITRLVAIFHDLGKIETKTIDKDGNLHFYKHEYISSQIAEKVLTRLNFNPNIIDTVKILILNHMIFYQKLNLKTISNLAKQLGKVNINRLFDLFEVNLKSKNKNPDEFFLNDVKKCFLDYFQNLKNLSFRDLDITGIDLINLGFEVKEINHIKQFVYEEVILGKIKNDKIEIIKYLFEKYNMNNELFMEKSCGAIVFKMENKIIKYLLVKIKGGNWGFPKGHVENGETEIETAIREVKEETNIDIDISIQYRESVKYVPTKNVVKEVVYFLGKAKNTHVILCDKELEAYEWATLQQSLKIITYSLQRNLILKANKLLIDMFFK